MILHNGDKNIELLVSDDSYSYEAIMGEDTLTLYFSHPGYLDVPVGSWCDFYGKRYSLKKDSNFKKNGERNFEYTLVLETSKADTLLWKVRNTVDNRIKFPYTAKPKEHLRMLVENLNRRGTGWKVGDCIDAAEKAIEYNHTYILDGLNQLAQAYETEWQITEVDNVKTVHLRKVEYNKENPLTLSYGKGHGFKVGVGRESGEIPPEIILVQGTDRNINFSKYGAKELLLPKSQTMVYEGRTYKSSDDGTCVMRSGMNLTTGKEESIDCTEIYPSRVGTVSSVIEVDAKNNFYDFVDKDIPVNLNFEECLIEGESMTVIFQTGMLVGKEFEVKYIHEVKDKKEARRFEIVPQEIDGITMPDDAVWRPTVGDTYAVFGIQLPDAYICDNDTQTGASWDMFKEAAKYLYEHEGKKFTFTGTLDGIWAKKRWLSIGGKIVLGGYVLFSDAQFHPDGSLIRMIGVKRYVSNPYSPEIELSNDPVGTSITSDLNKIETNEVVVDDKHKQALQFTKRLFRDAQETTSMLANSLLNFSGAINPITVATMQMLVGDESLQFRFVNSKTNPVQISHNITYNASTQILNAPAGIIQHMTLGITTVSSEHKAGEYKYWDMAEYNSPALIDPSKKFYLYAKCSKDNPSGTFLLSETAIKLEGIAGHYHLLVGVLNSEYDGERSFVELYGFTEILPGRITTERILSPDGKTYFDLVKGEIGGTIKFAAGSSGLANLDEWVEVSKDITNANDSADKANGAVSDLNKYVDGAFADGIITGAEAQAIEKYINVVKSAKSDVEATYNKLYMNGYLEGVAKIDLLNAKVTFSGSVDSLLASINNAIADKKTTIEEKQDVDTKYIAFNTAYSSVSSAIESANNAIQNKLKGYSDDARKYSDEISTIAKDNVAKGLGYENYAALEKAAVEGQTIINGGKINTDLIEVTTIITSQILANIINGNGLNIGGDKFVVSIDNNKQAHVSIKGHVEAESGTFKGRIEANEGVFYGSVAVPPQEIPNNSSNLTLSFVNGFNFAGLLSSGVKNIYLPTTAEYVGVECSIINYGGTFNGYYDIMTVGNNSFLYSGTPKNRNTINSIKLYGTSQLKLKAIKVSGSVRWFIDNYNDFSYDYINSCITNNLPSQQPRCIGTYKLISVTSLSTISCADGNRISMSKPQGMGRWTFTFQKARSANKAYSITINGELRRFFASAYNLTNTSFDICTSYYEYSEDHYADIAGWGFSIFEFDI